MQDVKALPLQNMFWGFKTDITHDHVLGISMNSPTKAFCPSFSILFVCNESCFCTFGRIDWIRVGWRLARGEDELTKHLYIVHKYTSSVQ